MNPMEDEVRLLLSRAITRSRKGWSTVATELGAMVGTRITESMLHECTRARRSDPFDLDRKTSKKLFPMDWVPALAQITGSHELERYALCEECKRALAVGKLGTAAMSRKVR